MGGLIARARSNRHHLVTREQLSVRSEMSRLLKLLRAGALPRVHGAVRRPMPTSRTSS